MTADIHDIADQRPHLMVAASDGAHVIPQALVRSVIAGDKPAMDPEDRELSLNALLQKALDCLE